MSPKMLLSTSTRNSSMNPSSAFSATTSYGAVTSSVFFDNAAPNPEGTSNHGTVVRRAACYEVRYNGFGGEQMDSNQRLIYTWA